MSAHLKAASSAYAAAMGQLAGLRGLLTEPLTERKLALLRQRLEAGGGYLATAYRLIDAADAEAPYTSRPPEGGTARAAGAAWPLGLASLGFNEKEAAAEGPGAAAQRPTPLPGDETRRRLRVVR